MPRSTIFLVRLLACSIASYTAISRRLKIAPPVKKTSNIPFTEGWEATIPAGTLPDPCKTRPGNLSIHSCKLLGVGSNGIAFEASVEQPGLWLHVPTDMYELVEGSHIVTKIVMKTSRYAFAEDWSANQQRKHWGELAREAGTMAYLWGNLVNGEAPIFQKHMPGPVPSGLLTDSLGVQWVSMEMLGEDWESLGSQVRRWRKAEAWEPWQSVIDRFVPIVYTVMKLHLSGWQHCDLHMDNIFMQQVAGGKFEVKLIDFGRAFPKMQGCAIAADADASKLLCTLSFMLGAKPASWGPSPAPCGTDPKAFLLKVAEDSLEHRAVLEVIADQLRDHPRGFEENDFMETVEAIKQYSPQAILF